MTARSWSSSMSHWWPCNIATTSGRITFRQHTSPLEYGNQHSAMRDKSKGPENGIATMVVNKRQGRLERLTSGVAGHNRFRNLITQPNGQ